MSLTRQLREIRAGGLAVVLRKIRTAFALASQRVARAIPRAVGATIRILKPIVWLRFGELSSSRIGHLSAEPDLYLCYDAAGAPRRRLDLFFHEQTPCNSQLALMWSRKFPILELARWLNRASSLIPGHEKHVVPMYIGIVADPQALLSKSPPPLRFTRSEESKGQAALRALGVPDGAPIACLHVRDTEYLKHTFPETDFTYHDFRNASASDYVLAAEALAQKGYQVIRIGARARDPLGAGHPGIIDYAFSELKSDFLDLYLIAKSRFLIGTTSGLSNVAALFRRPVLFANAAPLMGITCARVGDMLIPKKYRRKPDGRLMTFREIYESGAGDFGRAEQFREAGIELEDSTAEEIRDAVLEIAARGEGTWKTTAADEELQTRFQDVFRKSPNPRHAVFTAAREAAGGFVVRIGTQFLREYRRLLD